MRTRLVIIIIALILGGVAAVMAANYLESAKTRIEVEGEPITVLVAAQDIPRGMAAEELIEREMLVEMEIPRQFVSSDAVSSARVIEGQVLATPLAEGEQVTKARFQFPSQAGLSYTIPEGHLAITIPSDEIRGVAGFIKPGDFVTIIATVENRVDDERDTDRDQQEPTVITRIVLHEVKVLAVERQVSRTADDSGGTEAEGGLLSSRSQDESGEQIPDAITLALLPTDAEKIVFVEEEGSVWLALVGIETDVPVTEGITIDSLFE